MDRFFIIFNDISNEDVGVHVKQRPNIPSPKERVTVTPRSGGEDLHKHTGIYEDMQIEIEFSYKDELNFNEVWRQFKKWLFRYNDNKLRLSDDLDYFYKVCNVEISENARQELWEFGGTTVTFLVKPHSYLMCGLRSIVIDNNSSYYNPYEKALPNYVIEGEGNLYLTVNGNKVEINVGQKVEVNTELKKCFKSNEMINLSLVTGSFEDLYLQEGNNTFSWSVKSGKITKVTIIPNLREL